MTMVTIEEALDNAARILHQASDEIDLVKQEHAVAIANSWVDLANVLVAANA